MAGRRRAASKTGRWFFGAFVASLAVLVGLIAGGGQGLGGKVASALQPNGTSEVNQLPASGTLTPVGARITYTVTVTLRGPQASNQPLTAQLAISPTIINRTIVCPNSQAASLAANPACMWAPSVAGPYKMTISGDITGPITKAVPDGASVMCSDSNSSTSCDDELSSERLALVDTNGDVGTLPNSRAPIATSEVSQTPAGGSTAPGGTHIIYVATVTLLMSQAAPLAIQLKGDNNIDNRSYRCDSSTNIGRTQIIDTINPNCIWTGPVPAGTYTFTYSGTLVGLIGDAVPDGASVVCSISGTGATGTLGCDGGSALFNVPLEDKDGDVGIVQNGPAADPPPKPSGPPTPTNPGPVGPFRAVGIQLSRD